MAELGLLQEAAEDLIRTYHQKAPFVKNVIRSSDAQSRKPAVKIRTIGGRLCPLLIYGSPHGFWY
jgi:hypothetical protein